jgi:hypothetical protein
LLAAYVIEKAKSSRITNATVILLFNEFTFWADLEFRVPTSFNINSSLLDRKPVLNRRRISPGSKTRTAADTSKNR